MSRARSAVPAYEAGTPATCHTSVKTAGKRLRSTTRSTSRYRLAARPRIPIHRSHSGTPTVGKDIGGDDRRGVRGVRAPPLWPVFLLVFWDFVPHEQGGISEQDVMWLPPLLMEFPPTRNPEDPFDGPHNGSDGRKTT